MQLSEFNMKCGAVLLFGGLVILLLAVGVGWFAIPAALKYLILKASRIDPTSQFYESWVEAPPNVESYWRFYIFNVTNPRDIIYDKAKPIVTEMGPYVYKERRVKVDIERGTMHGTAQYRQKQFLTFEPELSSGNLSDDVTFLNFPLVSAVKFAINLTNDKIVHRMVEEMLIHGRRESLFRTHSVQELLFEGFPVKSFVDLLSDPTLSLVGDVPPMPEDMRDGLLALFERRNGSDDGLYEVDTGHGDPSNLGRIIKWNGDMRLPWWKDEPCSQILGTDGRIFPPYLDKYQSLNVFDSELCRTLRYEFEQENNAFGFTAWRFILSDQNFDSARINPDNACYCLEEDKSFCDKDGFLLMSGCSNGSPVVFSKPHFYDANRKYAADINGLLPERIKHESFIGIEPLTATTLQAVKRMQINFEVTAWPTIPYFARLGRNITFPLLWVEEFESSPPDMVDKLRQLYFALHIFEFCKWTLATAGILLFLIGIIMHKKQTSSSFKVKDLRN